MRRSMHHMHTDTWKFALLICGASEIIDYYSKLVRDKNVHFPGSVSVILTWGGYTIFLCFVDEYNNIVLLNIAKT